MTYYFEGKTQEEINEFMSQERWVDIKGYEGLYQVSNWGNVKSLRNKIILKNILVTGGYYNVALYNDGIRRNVPVHRLVLSNFLDKEFENLECNHLDENKKNNKLDNLTFCTAKENNNWGTRIERQRNKMINNPKLAKKVKQIDKNTNEVIKIWESMHQIDRETNFSKSKTAFKNISLVCKGKNKTAFGYRWEFVS